MINKRINNCRKIKFLFLLILSLVFVFFVISCTKTEFNRETFANTKYYPELAEEEMNRERTENKIPFTLNYQGLAGSPVCEFNINGIELITVLDTGASNNTFYASGLKKLSLLKDIHSLVTEGAIDFYKKEFPKKIENKTDLEIYELTKQAFLDGIFIINEDVFDLGKTNLNYFTNQEFDIILGQSFFRKYKTVTFDFINNYLLLDTIPMTEDSQLPLIINNQNLCYINVSYNNKSELGLVDTGNYTFIPRLGFGKSEINFDEYLNKNFYSYEEIKEKPTRILRFEGIKIGDIETGEVKGYYSNSIQARGMNNGARLSCMYLSNYGCELFRNHVIQFDYVNNLLYIK